MPLKRNATGLLLVPALLVGCRVAIPTATLPPQPVSYLERAHSHNDYLHARPLQDALDNGFASIEADVHLMDDRLVIGHILAWNPALTLQNLYLDPLRERIKANGGWVYAPGQTLILLIDYKTEARSTHTAVQKLLAQYADILTTVQDGQLKPGPVMVVITGNRDRELSRQENPRYSFQDGTLGDLQGQDSALLVPVVSDSWKTVFKWNGQGEMPASERQKLQTLSKQAREQGRKLRLWDAPDNLNTWAELLRADAGLINTDNLAGLRDFLLKNDPLLSK